jgi:hypothetical protein
LWLNTNVCVTISFSVRNGRVTVVAGIDDTIKENTQHLPLYHPDLSPIELVCGDIKNRVPEECMSTGLKQMQMFCEKIFAKYTKEKC